MNVKHQDLPDELKKLLPQLAGVEYCYLSTTGRKSASPHEIEIWFCIHGNSMYLLSGDGDNSDWVKNLLNNPAVKVRVEKHTFSGTARKVEDRKEEMMTRHILDVKYKGWKAGSQLSEWARTALPVAIDLINEEIIDDVQIKKDA